MHHLNDLPDDLDVPVDRIRRDLEAGYVGRANLDGDVALAIVQDLQVVDPAGRIVEVLELDVEQFRDGLDETIILDGEADAENKVAQVIQYKAPM